MAGRLRAAADPTRVVTPERFQLIEKIYYAALERNQSEREAFVADACSGDDELRREVESLLDGTMSTDGFLESPARAEAVRILADGADPDQQSTMNPSAASPHGASDHAPRLTPGQTFGPYRIERLLGRGGMGEVYEAEHLEHGRHVALKMLTQRLSDETDRARFLREGQSAAAVSHPHIVYIYGSEEITGIPVIAMELLPGGTLKDRVENTGPLAPVDAIDAIVQVISGLEAAHTGGILHRDVKPSNCFVDVDGTIKVGDFGLSIPTLERAVTQLTTTGTFQGTPEFASPEQLRGERLDIRSDIYAVGATLYYLLTGRPPFEDRDLMALVSRIATEPPPSLRKGRPQIPRALESIVLRCLAKNPADRPQSYTSLAGMLEPLGSSIKPPAPIGMRTAAYVFDVFFSAFLPLNILTALGVLSRPTSMFGTRPVVGHLLEVAYFAIAEGLWGASLGKALCGFRVVTEDGARPRFARTLLRALMVVLPRWLISGLVVSMAGFVYSMQGRSAIVATLTEAVVQGLLFVTARRANGFAGIHEWVTHTRTVLKSSVAAKHLLRPASMPSEVPASPRCVGPYRILDTSSGQPSGATLGYDDRLRRTVWLRFPGLDSDPVSHLRRELRRAARPRWLAGQRTSELAWDAYEHVPGRPFDSLLTRPQSWETVRGWLCDLGMELHDGLRDGSLPALEFDRVWIGDDGRVRLLDWPAPAHHHALAGSSPTTQAVDLPQAEDFLYWFAASALDGRALVETQPQMRTLPVPLPMLATDCLAKLREQRFATPEAMLTALTTAAHGPAAISRARRAVHLSLCAIPTVFMIAIGLLLVSRARPSVERTYPYVRSVSAGATADRAGVKVNDVVVAVDGKPTWFSSQLRDAIATHPNRSVTLSILRGGQPLMIQATPAQNENNEGRLGIEISNVTRETSLNVISRYLWLQTMAGLIAAATLGLLSSLAGRGGIAFRLMNIAVVTKNGARPSGLRLGFRGVLSWLPVLAASAAAFAGHSPLLTLTPPFESAQFVVVSPSDLLVFFPNEPSIPFIRVAIIATALVVFAVGAILILVRPERGLQDRLAATWLVPG